MATEKELLEKRGQLIGEMTTLGEIPKKEGRSLTKEENDKFDKIVTDEMELTRSIENMRKTEERLKSQQVEIEARAKEEGKQPDEVRDLKEKRSKAFGKYLREGMEGLDVEERNVLKEMRFNGGSGEQRAQSTTGSAGGYTIPEGFSYEIDKALKAYGGVAETSRNITTDTGNNIPWPKYDDTANVGEQLDENTEAADQDVTFGTSTLAAYKFSSKVILVSDELIQDSAFELESLLTEIATERLGRILNTKFTTGSGTSTPEGVVTASAAGATAATVAGIAFDDLLNLIHSVDPSYRKSPNAKLMFNDTTLKLIKKLSIGTNYTQPLWLPSIREGEPDTILGHKYVINQDMASPGANAKSILFGDFNKHIIRNVKGMWIKRLAEKYAEQFSTGFVIGLRRDSRFVGTAGAIKRLTHPAS